MRKFCTEFYAKRAIDGELVCFSGPNIEALNWQLARDWCYENAGHLTVTGELVAEIPCDEDYNPDFKNIVNYDNLN